MALQFKSLFLYGFQATAQNSSIDFRSVALETPRQATVTNGFYSLTSLMTEIARAMGVVDASNTYTVTANRNVSGGTENRVTIATSGSHFELLFGSGPRASSSIATLIGFASGVNRTGSTSYAGINSAGTTVVPNYPVFNYQAPEFYKRVFGSVNVSSSGLKEAIVYNIQKFWQSQFKYIPGTTWEDDWADLMTWMIQQRAIEFTPDISEPDTLLEGTLESTSQDGKGLAYLAKEMLPELPNLYDTGIMTFRQTTTSETFLT